MIRAIKWGSLNASIAIFGILMSLTTLMLVGSSKSATAITGSTTINIMNNQRRAAGLAALSYNAKLASSAYAKVQDMCAKHYWAHNAPDGTTPWSFVSSAGYSYTAVAENLAQGYTDDNALVAGWMASPGHRANILGTAYRDVGVASMSCNLVGSEVNVVVAHFGSTGAASAPVAAKKPAVAAPSAAPKAAVNPVATPATAQSTPPVAPTVVAKQLSFIEKLLNQLKDKGYISALKFFSA